MNIPYEINKLHRIDGFITSPYGIAISRRCRECYGELDKVIMARGVDMDLKKDSKGNRIRTTAFFDGVGLFCSKECGQLYKDWYHLQAYKKQLEQQRNKKLQEEPKNNLESIEKRKQYLIEYEKRRKEKKKKYYQDNREKIIKQVAINKLKKKQ